MLLLFSINNFIIIILKKCFLCHYIRSHTRELKTTHSLRRGSFGPRNLSLASLNPDATSSF